MLLSGDEYAHSKGGNNNTYCSDDQKNWFMWSEEKQNTSLLRFTKELINFRKASPLIGRKTFLEDSDISWHGLQPGEPNWGSFFIAGQLHGKNEEDELYFAFNAQDLSVHPKIPSAPEGKEWLLIANSSNQGFEDFFRKEDAPKLTDEEIPMKPYSSILLCTTELTK